MTALSKAKERSMAVINTASAHAIQLKASGMLDRMVSPSMSGSPTDWQQQSKSRQSYAQYTSWVFAAVHALATEGMMQPVNVGKVSAAEEEKAAGPFMVKSTKAKKALLKKNLQQKMVKAARQRMIKARMPRDLALKSAESEVELIPNHELIKLLNHPNPLQHRQQFVYSFIANLCLTGRAYIVRDQGENGVEYYSLPTTWVRPDHKEGPWSKFYVANPQDMDFAAKSEPLDASQVAFAYFPNPANPMGCLSPASSQSPAIRVDDRIQTCQEKFFDNGIFPSAIVVVGKEPHPDIPGGARPRLTGSQRRQVYGAIKRVMGSVANFGNPAIVDGLIENILPFGRNQTDLGWDKSEDKLKTRILSAFCVHPYILGEAVSVGGYAQVYNIEKRFYSRINIFLDLLSTLMTSFVAKPMTGKGKVIKPKPGRAATIARSELEELSGEELLVWWEQLVAEDPSMKWANLKDASTRGVISRNEYRAELGYPPDEDYIDPVITKDVATVIAGILPQISAGAVGIDQAQGLFEGMGLEDALAAQIAGPEPEPPEEQMGGEFGMEPPEDSLEAIGQAVAALRRPLDEKVLDESRLVLEYLEQF